MNEQLAARPGSSNGRDFLLAKCLCVKLACAIVAALAGRIAVLSACVVT